MRKEEIKAIYKGQMDLVDRFGYTIERIKSNYGYNEAHYKEVNNKLCYAYKTGFNDCIEYIKNLSKEQRDIILNK